MATFFIPVNTPNTLSELAKHFSKKSALSKESAIEVSQVDWVSMGFTRTPVTRILKQYPFIKEIDGKYWLDQGAIKDYQNKQKRILNWTIIIGVILILIVIALPFVI